MLSTNFLAPPSLGPQSPIFLADKTKTSFTYGTVPLD